MYEDKALICADCGREFIWTAGEQEFYAERGFQNEPTRCPECRKARKQQRNSGNGDRAHRGGARRPHSGDRVMYDAVCARCGKPCKVPFEPSEDRPVYCSDCYSLIRAEQRRI